MLSAQNSVVNIILNTFFSLSFYTHLPPTLTPNPTYQHTHTHTPISGRIITEVGQKVVVQFPENVEGDSAVWRADGLVDLPEDQVPVIEVHIL